MDRPHRGPAGPARAGGAPVTADLPAAEDCEDHRGAGPGEVVRRDAGAARRLAGVRQGEIVAVMGPSGSGKSTLLHCLAGILVPEKGEVWFGGQRLDTLSDDRRSALRRDRLGFVFQSGQLVPELTAEENVALPLLLSGTRRGPAMTAARNWFGTLGLAALSRAGPGNCPAGRRSASRWPAGWSPNRGAVRRRAEPGAGRHLGRTGDRPARAADRSAPPEAASARNSIGDPVPPGRSGCGPSSPPPGPGAGFIRTTADPFIYLHKTRVQEQGATVKTAQPPGGDTRPVGVLEGAAEVSDVGA